MVLADVARGAPGGGPADAVFVARDDVRAARAAEVLAFFAPDVEVLLFPAWDCLPYDRVSPHADIVGRRVDTLTRLLDDTPARPRRVVLTTVSALLQRVPPRAVFAGSQRAAATGQRLDPDDLLGFLLANGYGRTGTVREAGEFAVRGGIVDVFPPGQAEPLRLDFFGDELDGIRRFDPTTQLSSERLEDFILKPVGELFLDDASVQRFRSGYRTLFGTAGDDDPLYEAVSAGRRHMGMEHWLPLFHEPLETLLDYVPAAAVVLDHQAEEARDTRLALIEEYYEARQGLADGGLATAGTVYHPLPPDRLFLDAEGWEGVLAGHPAGQFSPFAAPNGGIDAGGRPGRDFADVRVLPGANVFDAVRDHIAEELKAGRRVVVAAYTRGSRDRLASVLREHGVEDLAPVDDWAVARARGSGVVALAVLAVERGFTTPELTLIGEQDILGDRLARAVRPRASASVASTPASSSCETAPTRPAGW